ncbi:unnamed protein product [Mucor hiemalis]
MSLSQRLFSEAFRDMQRAMAVFEQPTLFNAAVTPSSFGSQAGNLFRYPATDLIEKPELYELQAELPGYDKNNIKIELPDSQTLILSGSVQEKHESRSPPTTEATQDTSVEASTEASTTDSQAVAKMEENTQVASFTPQYWVNERVSGSFKRSFKFPNPVKSDDIKASFENGILKVIVPKITETQSKQVTIE